MIPIRGVWFEEKIAGFCDFWNKLKILLNDLKGFTFFESYLHQMLSTVAPLNSSCLQLSLSIFSDNMKLKNF